MLIAVVVVVFVLATYYDLGGRLSEIQNWIEGLGPLGPIAFIFIYIGTTIAAIPGTFLGLIAGALFGSLVGVIVVSIGSTVGASICFLIARYFARDAVERWLKKSKRFEKLDKMTEDHGPIIVAITRLVPIFPFNLLNYGFGLTRISFRTYVFWSWLCMLPGTILFVVGGDAFSKFMSDGEVSFELIAVIVVFAVILALIIRYARKSLKEKDEKQQ